MATKLKASKPPATDTDGAGESLVAGQTSPVSDPRQQANPEVSSAQAQGIKNLGGLYAGEEDTMTLHTAEAYRLYLGVTPSPSENRYGISGAKRAAWALRQLHTLTVRDNPYADWVLIQVDELNFEVMKLISNLETKSIKKLDDMKKKGLNYSIVGSRSPQTVSLGYRSPYGYAVTNTVVSFDYLVRVLRSIEMRDLMTKNDMHDELQRVKTRLRSMFEFAAKAQRFLLNADMQMLCRNDYVSKDAQALKRIAAAKQVYGDVPVDIFTHGRLPRHTLWNQKLTKAERDLLNDIANQQDIASPTKEELAAIASGNLVGGQEDEKGSKA